MGIISALPKNLNGQMYPPAGMTTKKRTIGLNPRHTGLNVWLWLMQQEDTEDPVIAVSPTWESFFKEAPALVRLEPFVVLISGNVGAGDMDDIAEWAASNIRLVDDYFTTLVVNSDEVMRRIRKLGTVAYD